jgi:hypothetical protein
MRRNPDTFRGGGWHRTLLRKTFQACGSMSRLRISSTADQPLHVCSSTSVHPHSQQALHSTLNCLRLREYVEGNSSLHFNLSHSTPTRIPDRRQSNRSPPIKTSGHSHLSPKPYPFNRVSIPF